MTFLIKKWRRFEMKCETFWKPIFDRISNRILKCDISDSRSPSNLCIECHRHFCVSLICREYAFQLRIEARDTYVSKMCGSWVIIEMVMGECSKKKNRQLYLALLSRESSKYTRIKHRGTKCANVHLSTPLCPFSFFCASLQMQSIYLHVRGRVCVCALRHSSASKLTADSKSNV